MSDAMVRIRQAMALLIVCGATLLLAAQQAKRRASA